MYWPEFKGPKIALKFKLNQFKTEIKGFKTSQIAKLPLVRLVGQEGRSGSQVR